MDVFDLQAKISIDTTPYIEALRRAATETERLRTSMSAPISSPLSVPSGTGTAAGGTPTPGSGSSALPTVTTDAEKAGKAIDDLNKKIGDGFSKAVKLGAAAWGTFSAAAVAATKKAVDGYAQYEQLVGGVDTLFKESSEKVQRYAEQAYKTTGMSANTYMQTITSFSASLLNSLDNDTEKAAEKANTAITDMADNSNKMGTSLESLTRAYMGFSRQNFTMLDNLALGFSGTKQGMQELLNKAEELSGIKYDISSYADIVDAIHVIQQEMGITGTTAKEAADTIEGSMNSTKAAIDNLLVGFARSDADINKLVDDVDKNIRNVAKNVIPVAERAFVSMSKVAIKAGADIAKELPRLIGKAVTDVHKMIAENFGASANDIYAIETALKAAAAGFVAFKAAAYVADIVDKIRAVNTAMQGTVSLTEALNAANLANPYVLAATAIAAATVALKSYIDIQTDLIDEAVDGYDLLTGEQKEMVDGVNDLSQTIAKTRSEWDKTANNLTTNSELYSRLTQQLYEMDSAENISSESKEKMRIIVNQLNGEIDGLNIELDEQTGHLKTQKKAIDDIINSYQKQARSTAYQEHLTELYKQQIQSEKNLKAATDRRNETNKETQRIAEERARVEEKINDFFAKHTKNQETWSKKESEEYTELFNQSRQLSAQYEEQVLKSADVNNAFINASESARQLQDEINGVTSALVENDSATSIAAARFADTGDAITAALTGISETAAATLSDPSNMLIQLGDSMVALKDTTAISVGQIIDEYDKMYKSQYQSIAKSIDLYKGFEADTTTTYNDLYKNLSQTEHYLNDWTNAIEQLQAKVDKGLMSQNFLDSLKDMGLDSWNIVYNMNHATEDQLKEYSDMWVRTNAEVKESTDRLMQRQKEQTEQRLSELTGIADSSLDEYKTAFENLGIATGSGFEKGIRDSIGDAKKAAKEMGSESIESVAEAIDAHSPSKEFQKLGEYAVQGFAIGFDNTAIVELAARTMAERAIKSAKQVLDSSDISSSVGSVSAKAGTPTGGGQNTQPTYVFNLLAPNGEIIGKWLTPYIDAQQGRAATFVKGGYAQ